MPVVVGVLLFGLGSAGVQGEVKDLAPLLEPIRKDQGVPALAALVIGGRETRGAGAVGVRRRGSEDPVRITDRFHLGSCTKSMTATLIGRLVEKGTLSWSTTIHDVFKDPDIHGVWKAVTLEQLLTHHAGAPNAIPPALFGKLWLHDGTPVEQRRTLVDGILGRKPEAPPGTKYIYSNAGFCIAGAMAEKATGTPWEELMRREVFKPLGMGSAGFGPPGTEGTLDQPRGHFADGTPAGVGRGADNPPSIGPAGRVHASLGDWAKYIAFHLRFDPESTSPGNRSAPSLLRPATVARLHRPVGKDETRYAMGWLVLNRDWGGGRVYSHSGSNTMWTCVVWMAPKKDFAVLVAANQGGEPGFEACDAAASVLIQDSLER